MAKLLKEIKFDIDTTDFDIKRIKFADKAVDAISNGIGKVADEIMRLSQFEVPHDTGELQNSGMVDQDRGSDEATVGYNKVYAARLHEHPEYNFQKGRKGKYLEDPIKHNLHIFLQFLGKTIRGGLT